MSASGHRMNAKKALEGKWGLAVGAGIVATILGGATVEGDDLALRFMKIVIDENNNTLLYTIMIFVLLYSINLDFHYANCWTSGSIRIHKTFRSILLHKSIKKILEKYNTIRILNGGIS